MNLIKTFSLIVPQWLTIKEISKLDVAMVNKLLREQYLDLMRSESSAFGFDFEILHVKGSGFLLWLKSRNIKLRLEKILFDQCKSNENKLHFLSDGHFESNVISFFQGIKSVYVKDSTGFVSFQSIECILRQCHSLRDITLHGDFIKRFISMDNNNYNNNNSFSITTQRMSIATLFGQLCGYKLLQLRLFYGGGFSDKEINCILQQCPNLEVLICSYVDSDGGKRLIQSITQHCRHIKVLDVGWCRSVTDEDIILLLQTCRNLHTLSLKCGMDITDTTINAIVSDAVLSRNLQELNIIKCHRVTGAAMILLVETCVNLHTLHVTLDGSITEEAVEFCMENYPRVSYILSESNAIHSLH